MPAARNDNEDRPLTARSVLASALLGESPPELPVDQLIRLAGLFRINENRARVALSRMAANGELSTSNGRYRLISESLLQRQTRQQRSLRGVTPPWDGSWLIAIIVSPTATAFERGTRRITLTRARFGERRDGVWMRPNNLDRLAFGIELGPTEIEFFSAIPQGDPKRLAGELWDLDAWHNRAWILIDRMTNVAARTSDDLAPGFVLSASILRHVQADPLLPEALLPSDWPGAALRERYDEWNTRYRQLLRPTKQRAENTPLQ